MRHCALFTIWFATCICFLHVVMAFEPISGITMAMGAMGAAVSSFILDMVGLRSYVMETCSDRWIKNNYTGLTPVLHQKLYGQHLVIRAVSSHIRGHIKTEEPLKALTLSFHGGTGTGKNYVSRLIAEHLYKGGMKSKFVHLISAAKEFPHKSRVPVYKDQLRAWIEGNVTQCPQSVFIFDEMDKMPPGLIDTIKPYLDYYDNLGGVSYRNAIFFFLSNTAGSDITNHVLEHWRKGSPREDIKLADLEKIIAKATVNTNTETGLWHSELITKHMITAYIPFLPLEKSHIRECIRDSMVVKGYCKDKTKIPKDYVESVLAEMTFYPETEQAFSITGCKRVAEKVDFVMEEFSPNEDC